jgi:cytochrome oxidase Cu insertion factor (SCO1/SenC/PrrC family)
LAGANPAIWTFLTGDRATIDRFAAAMGVGLIRPADSVEITHNLRTILIDPGGRITTIYSGNEWKVADVLSGLRKSVAASRRP